MQRKLFKLAILFALGIVSGIAFAQTTTIYTGVIKDLGNNIVTSGQVAFTLTPSSDSTIPGTGRFTPSTVTCNIQPDGTMQSQTGGACVVTKNTALSPTGTSYRICIQAYFATPGSCFFDYAVTDTKDISTIAPTLSTGPINYGGVPGPTPNIGVGSVTQSGSSFASVSVTGTPLNPLFNFVLPTGPAGTDTFAVHTAPTLDQTVTQPVGTYTKFNAPSLIGNFLTTNSNNQTIHAWGNSQTQGAGLPGCPGLTCHPDTAWPAVFAAKMGWTLDNQAYGSSNCADLSYQGTSSSLWDLPIDGSSRNIFAHFRNDQAQYGYTPRNTDISRGCIQAMTAWLAIPEASKTRASSSACAKTGSWTNGDPNSATSYTASAGATLTCTVVGKTVYVVAANIFNSNATYSVTVDGVPIFDPISQSTTFTQFLPSTQDPAYPVNENITPYLIRVPGLNNASSASVQQHTIVYTCVNPATSHCMVFFVAGVNTDNSTANGPFVYSLSPIYNAPSQQVGNMAPLTTSLFYDEWRRLVAELDSDGLQVIGIDATNPITYNPADPTQVQADGVHPAVPGAANIGNSAVSKATSAATPLDRAESKAPNCASTYDMFGCGPPPSTAGKGPTAAGYYLSKGSLFTSTGPLSGNIYFGSDGTASLSRNDGAGFGLGSGHTFFFSAVDSIDTNVAIAGQVTSSKTAAGNGGMFKVINGDKSGVLLQQGATPVVGSWPANSTVLESRFDGTGNGPLVLDALGATNSVLLQANRTTLGTLSPTGMVWNTPNSVTYVIPTLTTAPTGACSPDGTLALSLDGHASSCAAGAWVSRW